LNFFVGFILNIGFRSSSLWLCLESELNIAASDFVIAIFGCGDRSLQVLLELWNLRQDRGQLFFQNLFACTFNFEYLVSHRVNKPT
jgi:hypothetical protein